MNKNILLELGMTETINQLSNGNCPICKKQINIEDFKDTLSIKEFTISGLCQECQDKIFGS